jgi:hypothetical protein
VLERALRLFARRGRAAVRNGEVHDLVDPDRHCYQVGRANRIRRRVDLCFKRRSRSSSKLRFEVTFLCSAAAARAGDDGDEARNRHGRRVAEREVVEGG